MADLTKTITDSLGVFGGQPPNVWGVMVWNVDTWNAGSLNEVQHVGKVITNTETMTESIVLMPTKVVTNSQGMTDDLVQLTLTDAAGYFHVFLGNTTDADDIVPTSWTAAASPSTSWSSPSAPSTTWSQA